jgi:hypothetical protein
MPKKLEIGFEIRNKDLSNDDKVFIPSLSGILSAVVTIKKTL